MRAAAVLAAAALLLGAPGRAWAHAHLRESSPAAGSTVDASVRELRLRFSEGVEPAFTSVALTGPGGAAASASALAFPADGGGRVAVLPLTAALAPGRWTVAWKAAAMDGHASHGTFSFTVRASSPAPSVVPTAGTRASAGVSAEPRTAAASDVTAAPSDQTAVAPDANTAAGWKASESMHRDSPVEVAVRWIGLMALLAMVGAVAFRFAALRGPADAALAADVERRTSTVALGAALLSAPAMLGRLWAELAAMEGAGGMGALLARTAWGHAWILQLAATVVFAAAILLARRGVGGGWTLAAVPALVLAAVPALSGHAASAERPALALALDWLHVLGASVWLGMLLVLLAAGIPAALARRGQAPEAFAALVNRFSPVALAGAAAAAATGIGSAWLRLDAVSQLWTTGYGRALLVKLALLAFTGAIGAYNWRSVRPALGTGGAILRLRSTARAEIALGALALLATAVLVAMPTP